MASRVRNQASLLEAPPRDHAGCAGAREVPVIAASEPDLGDLVIVLLASTLAGLRDRLMSDGFADAAGLVADLVEIVDDYLTRAGH